MPVLDAERRSATRSALRYRPIDPATSEQGPVVSRRRRSRPDILTTTSRVEPDELDQEEDRYPARQRSASVPAVPRKSTPPARARRQFHPLFFIGLGLFATQLIVWGTNEYNTMVYGYPRTFQIDQVVGHHDSSQNPSHFIAMNLKGQIVVIEMPGGEVSKSIVFRGPTLSGPGGDLVPVTLTFQDVRHNGKPNMIVSAQGNQFVFLNENGTFVPSPQSQISTS